MQTSLEDKARSTCTVNEKVEMVQWVDVGDYMCASGSWLDGELSCGVDAT